MKYKNIRHKPYIRKDLYEYIKTYLIWQGFANNVADLIKHNELKGFDDEQVQRIMHDINCRMWSNLFRLACIYNEGKNIKSKPGVDKPIPELKIPISKDGIKTQIEKYYLYKSHLHYVSMKVGLWCFSSNRGRVSRRIVKKLKMIDKEASKLRNMPCFEITTHPLFLDILTVIKS